MRKSGFLCFLFFVATTGMANEKSVCTGVATVYQEKIFPKVRSGIPFELMSVTIHEEKIICQQPLQIRYSLWDEKVTLKHNDKTLAHVELAEAQAKICEFLVCEVGGRPPAQTQKLSFKVLLNPLWEGRIARLQGRSSRGGSSDRGLININWAQVIEKLPSEQILFEGEYWP